MSQKKADNFYLGSEYIGNKEEVHKLYQEWDAKLKAEGFKDIEYKMPDGRIHPYFNNGPATATMAHKIDLIAQVYYEKTREFTHVCKWSQFSPYTDLYKQIWIYYNEGVSFRHMEKLFMGESVRRYSDVKPVTGLLRRKSSYYFYFSHTHKILDAFWKWMEKQGYSDPRGFKGSDRLLGERVRRRPNGSV